MFFFTTSDGWTIYMGRDKYENDELIAHSFGEDVWFHVDEVSSAHVYLRLGGSGLTIDQIPPKTLAECAQLVKANSISGCKMATVTVIYTYVKNLKKEQTMAVGTVSFHDMKQVHYIRNLHRDKEIVKMLEKTRTEKTLDDLKRDKDERQRAQFKREKEAAALAREKAAQEEKERKEKAELECYASVMREENMHSNQCQTQSFQEYEDDFM